MPKIQIEKIRITIGEKTLELTSAELIELRAVLDATFPEQMPNRPIIIEGPEYPARAWRYWNTIWCSHAWCSHAYSSIRPSILVEVTSSEVT